MEFSNTPVLTLQKAVIFQDLTPVLTDVTIEIGKGEFVYLVGRTGSGKSSLLKTLYADLELKSGDGEVAGYKLRRIKASRIPLLRRKLGIIFQDFQLLLDRTVAENLTFVLKATGWKDSSKIKSRLAEVLMRVGLGSVAGKYPLQLSGGEQQRVVIARALLNEPLLLIADEPTGNLDTEVADEIMKLFLEINRSGTAILMATHNLSFLHTYPARTLRCESGKVIEVQ